MNSLKSILQKKDLFDRKKYITREFQDYGVRLAYQLRDEEHTSLYIKLAKTMPRERIEKALTFVKDATNARSKAKLFLWKLGQLNHEAREAEKQK